MDINDNDNDNAVLMPGLTASTERRAGFAWLTVVPDLVEISSDTGASSADLSTLPTCGLVAAVTAPDSETGAPAIMTGSARLQMPGCAGSTSGSEVPVHPLRRPVTADRPTDVGTVTHAVIGSLADQARQLTPPEVADAVLATAGRLVVNKVASRRRAVWFEAAGYASLYLRCLVPPAPWVFLGAEYPSGAGRVDLAWEHPDRGVIFDELKTTGHGGVTDPGPAYLAQCCRYASAGEVQFGTRFVGVRLIVLGGLQASRLVFPDGTAARLSGGDPAGTLLLGGLRGQGGAL